MFAVFDRNRERRRLWQMLFGVALDYPFANVDGTGDMILGPFAFFTDIDEVKVVAPVVLRFDLVDCQLANLALGILDDLEEAG